MNKPYFCRKCFCRHERLKNTTDLLLFYGEHFYGFSESVLSESGMAGLRFTDTSD